MGAPTPTVPPPAPRARLREWAAWAVKAAAAVALGALAGRYGLPEPPLAVPPLPLVDEAPVDYEGCRFHGDHGDAHHLHDAQPARWPVDRITYGIDYPSARGMSPPLSDDAIRAAFRTATGWWAEHLAVEFVEVAPAQAHIPIRFEPMDGPAGVLAEAYLADGTTRAKPMRFDARERWTAGLPAANLVSLPTVACHELGHSLGLGHDSPSAPAVMRPSYTSQIPREQERDVARMVALGYKRREKVPPAPSDVLSFPVQVRTADVVEALTKAGYKVTK